MKRPFLPVDPKPGKPFQHHSAWLDSTSLHMAVEAMSQVEENGRFRSMADKWVVY